MEQSQTHLIIGFGYLGQTLIKRYPRETCWLVNRSGKIIDSANHHHQLILDINQSSDWHLLSQIEEKENLIVYFMVPPSKIDLDQFPSFIQTLDQLNIKKRILVSSTVVYGRLERIVNADSEVMIDSERAKLQHQIENEWLKDNKNNIVVRLAGLYGPGRIIGRSSIERAEALSGDPGAWLNLIHVEDAASLLVCLAQLNHPNKIELGSNGVPLRRSDYYSILAELLKKKLPVFKKVKKDKGRCCDIELTTARTGWTPKHTDIRSSLENII